MAVNTVNIGIDSVDSKRTRVSALVDLLDTDVTHSISDEYFMTRFSKLQVVLAEFFASEEEVIRLIGMPDSDKRKHILEHDRLLDIFHKIYVDAMGHRNTMAVEVYGLLKSELAKHINEYDSQLGAYIRLPAPE